MLGCCVQPAAEHWLGAGGHAVAERDVLHLPVLSAVYACLPSHLPLQSMLSQDPTKRPSAEELLKQVAKCSSKSGLAVASSSNRRSL